MKINYFTVGINETGSFPADNNIGDINYTDGGIFEVRMLEPGEDIYVNVENEKFVVDGKQYRSGKKTIDNYEPVLKAVVVDADDTPDGIKVKMTSVSDNDVTLHVTNVSGISKEHIIVAYMYLKNGSYEMVSDNVEEQHLHDIVDDDYAEVWIGNKMISKMRRK